MVTREVPQPAEFQDTWLSYAGALAGTLTALGTPTDVVEVAGRSGLAFLLNVTEGWTDPGSATLHSGNVARTGDAIVALWREMTRGVEALGPRLEHAWDPEQYRFYRELDETQRARARRLFERVRASIDAGRPAVVWGLSVPEYGLVNGYDDDHYRVSTFRHHVGQPEDPIRWDSLQAKGGLEAIFVEPAVGAHMPDDREAVARALRLGQGVGTFTFETPGHPIREVQRYVTGSAAYAEWARTLDNGVKGTLFYEYNSYNAACLHAAREAAAVFLSRLAEHQAGKRQAEPLAQAAESYASAAAELRSLTQLCPYADTGDLTPAQCRQGSALLRAARPHEERALAHLASAVERWT
jgi:hypothetical protein